MIIESRTALRRNFRLEQPRNATSCNPGNRKRSPTSNAAIGEGRKPPKDRSQLPRQKFRQANLRSTFLRQAERYGYE
jgi:hypothetical protein